jgi:hypothetical protein
MNEIEGFYSPSELCIFIYSYATHLETAVGAETDTPQIPAVLSLISKLRCMRCMSQSVLLHSLYLLPDIESHNKIIIPLRPPFHDTEKRWRTIAIRKSTRHHIDER